MRLEQMFERQLAATLTPQQQADLAQSCNIPIEPTQQMQQSSTGATRSSDEGKNDYEGFLSMPAIEEFGDYMTRHRTQADGKLRESDNWQKGMPLASYLKSLLRHVLELVGLSRGYISKRLQKEYPNHDFEFLKRETACACWFNIQGYLHELVKPVTISGEPGSRIL